MAVEVGMRHTSWITLFITAAALGAGAATASAQRVPSKDPSGMTSPSDEGPIAEPDIPDAPPDGDAITVDDLDGTVRAVKKPRYTKKTFPIELTKRPLTLAEAQAEVSLDSPFVKGAGNPVMWQVLRARYGITRDIEAGITYSFGLLNLSPPEGTDTFEPGKAFSFDGGYTIWAEHIAVTLSLPFYADPDTFGMGVNLSIPMRLNLGSRWAIFGGHDLLQLRVVKMPVDAANPAANLAQVAAVTGGAESSTGTLAVKLGGMYQHRPNLAFYTELGFIYPDFNDLGAPISFFGGATWSRHSRLDLGGRVGLYDMDDSDSFSLAVYAAYRL
jgi:hypothetical protein